MQKKLIIGGIVFIIISAAVLTVLKLGMSNMGSLSEGGYGEMMATDAVGLPNSAGISSFSKNNEVVRESRSDLAQTSVAPSVIVDKKIIKNGSLNLKVNSVDKSSESITQIAKENGGDVFSSNVYNRNNIKSGTMAVKVPVANFEKTFNEIKKVAALVVQESATGQDVTEEYTDLQGQLKNKQAEEQQFVQIMGQAQKIQDILDVTQQLSRVRGEIESLQGRIKFLNSQADMSSISITMSEDTNITITDSWRPWQVIKDAVNALIKKGQGFINFVIVLVITVIPVAVLYLLLAYIAYRIGRKIYLKFKKPEQQ